MIKLIAGLGNPGPKYSNSYHNAGIIAIEAMPHGKWRHVKGKKFEAAKSANYIFIKPLTFMNESGVAIRESLRYFKIKPENMGLVHDDSDIYLGKYKLSRGRGAAGHKGVQSVIESVGTKNFWRLRIGIRPVAPPAKISERSPTSPRLRRMKAGLPAEARRAKAGDFVLKNFRNGEREILNAVIIALNKELEKLHDLQAREYGIRTKSSLEAQK